MLKVPSSKKLWRIVKERDNFYYEIKLDGVVVDRLKVEEPALDYFKKEGLI